MIATNDMNYSGAADYLDDSNGGFGTADVTAEDRWSETVDAIGHIDMAERSAWINDCRMRLFETLGAVLHRSGGAVLYWREYQCEIIAKFVLIRRPVVILAGFMPEGRGRHWDRKSRKRIK